MVIKLDKSHCYDYSCFWESFSVFGYLINFYVQVNGADIEKVSRHCPALKVLHLFFVVSYFNFQPGHCLVWAFFVRTPRRNQNIRHSTVWRFGHLSHSAISHFVWGVECMLTEVNSHNARKCRTTSWHSFRTRLESWRLITNCKSVLCSF